MDDFRVALDGFDYSLFLVDEASGNLVSLVAMDHHVDVFDPALESLAIFTDDLEIQVVVVHWLTLLYVFFVVEDEGKQLILTGNEAIEKGLERVADGDLAIGNGADESGGLEEEVKKVVVFLHIVTAD